MTPEAIELTTSRIAADLREADRSFRRAVAQKEQELAARGMGASSGMISLVYDLAKEELSRRALHAWEVCRRLLDADDAEPSAESREQVSHLIERAVTQLSGDVDAEYSGHRPRFQGNWPSLDEARQHALAVALSELDIDLLRRRRRRVPLAEALSAPRYSAASTHWTKAKSLMDSPSPDPANAVKEGVCAIEALAKVVLGGRGSTLGNCVKTLRARGLIDPGMDNVLEGLWTFSNAGSGVRHGDASPPSMTEREWHIVRPMIEGALLLLLTVDAGGAI